MSTRAGRGVRPRLLRSMPRGRALSASAAFAFAGALALVAVSPLPALATYADVTDAYPASQRVSAAGEPIPASKIPDGTYKITASTSSYMCAITNCTLTVRDGTMSATFTLSRAYTRIYLGTAEEAAAHTNADGTDDSAYYRGNPAEGYVPHVYTLPVSALNAEVTLATYAGGTKTCKWFTRTAVFNSSSAVDEAVATGVSPVEPAGRAEAVGEEAGAGSQSAAESDAQTASEPSVSGKPEDKPSSPAVAGVSEAGSVGGSSARTASASASPSADGGPGASGAVSAGDAGAKVSGSGAGAAPPDSSPAKPDAAPHVVELTPAVAGSAPRAMPAGTGDGAEVETGAPGLVVAGALAAGTAALLAVLCVMGHRVRRARRALR